MENESLNEEVHISNSVEKLAYETSDVITISKQIAREFENYEIPFLDCDFNVVYPAVANILPTETVSFYELSFEDCIACEVICAAVCHQMNWDFLRKTVLVVCP